MFSSIKAGLDASREETGLEWSKLETFESLASDAATNGKEVAKTKVREFVLVVIRGCGMCVHVPGGWIRTGWIIPASGETMTIKIGVPGYVGPHRGRRTRQKTSGWHCAD